MDKNYLMAFDEDGNILGFYPKDMLEMYQDLPSKTVEITDEKHDFYLQNQGRYKINIETHEDVYIEPIQEHSKPSEIVLLKEQVSALQDALLFLMG